MLVSRSAPPTPSAAADRHIAAGGGCIACGRCAPACPTGAIEVAGFTVAVPPAADPAAPVTVECRRLSKRAGTPETIRVSCLGGLGTGHLIELRLAAGDRPIHLIDRGWCADCPAGGVEHPVRRAVEATAALLSAMGTAALAPSLVCRPLPRRHAAGVSDDDAPAAARRLLLRRLAGLETGEMASEPPPVRRVDTEPPLDPTARQRTTTALAALALRLNALAPPAVEQTVAISERCQNHQVCVRVCPTGALAAGSEAQAETLVFDDSRCIASGACERSCPESALVNRHAKGSPDRHRKGTPLRTASEGSLSR